jgi:hypothetical protein
VPGDLRARFTRLEALSALNRREWWRGGQHLKRRKRYLGGHLFDRVKGLYFTTGRPEYDGIRAERMQREDMARPPTPGFYPRCSVTPTSR